MARTPKKLAPAPGVLLSLDAAKKLRERAGSLIGKTAPLQLGWEPNDCYHCDGTGYIPGKRKRAVHYCHACGGLGKGPQAKALLRLEKEIFYGGAKGGGKTDCMTIWMASGNPHQPNFNQHGAPIQHNQTYVAHPNFRGLVIRKNVGDLKAWISTAKKYYRKLGGEYINGEFRFPSGATIWVGHMDDDDSWMKYQGAPELHRVGWEEVCQIRNRDSYMHMISCVRTTTPGLRAQLFLTGNPIGPGFGWVRDRFVRVKNKKGELIPPGTPIRQIVKHPVTGADIQMGRIFIPAGLRDNPHLMADPEYVGSLMLMPVQLRRAYLDGDWEAMGGNFFSEFRPEGALAGEPEAANHCVGPRNTAARQRKEDDLVGPWLGEYPELKPWWPRIIGGDWGFSHNSAFYWGAVDPSTGLNHIYRERIYNQTSIEEVGFEIAKASREDLIALPGKAMTLYFSRDAFDSRNRYIDGSTSFVEMFRDGMEKAIGPDAVHIPQFEPENRSELLPMHAMKDFDGAYRDYQAQVSAQRESGITVVKAMTSRVVGAQLIREVLKWTPPIEPNAQGIDWEVFTKIAMEYGMNQAAKYQLEHTPAPLSACPRVLIWEEACPHLIQALTVAQHDRKNAEDVERDHWKGADSYDAFRYCLNGMEAAASLDPPYEETRAKAKEDLMEQNPQATVPDMIWMEMHLDNEKRASEAMLRAPVGRDATRNKRAARGRFQRKLAGRTN